MPTMVFVAEKAAQGAIYRFTVCGPNMQAIRALLEAQHLGTPGTLYKPFIVPENPPVAQVLCVEIAGPVLSGQNVQGGQPTAQPIGQRGREAQGRPRDFSGFDDLPDHALPTAGDEVFGDLRDGTYTDLMSDGRELPRQIPHGPPGS